MGKTIGYIRVSTDKQTTQNQKLAILDNGNKHKWSVDDWIEVTASSRRTPGERRIEELMTRLEPGDTIVVSELSRLGRSVGQIAALVDELIKRQVNLRTIKEMILLDGNKRNLQTKVMITMFSLFAEIERDLISERTKEGLARARAAGRLIGRPRGPGRSRLDDHAAEIRTDLNRGVKKIALAARLGTSEGNLRRWLRQHNL